MALQNLLEAVKRFFTDLFTHPKQLRELWEDRARNLEAISAYQKQYADALVKIAGLEAENVSLKAEIEQLKTAPPEEEYPEGDMKPFTVRRKSWVDQQREFEIAHNPKLREKLEEAKKRRAAFAK